MRRALFFVFFVTGGILAAWQTSTSKATQAGQTTPKTTNGENDQSGTTGSNTGLPAAKAGATSTPAENGLPAKKHRKHRGRHKTAAN